MQVRNETSRYHLIIQTLEILYKRKVISKQKAKKIIDKHNKKLEDHCKYIKINGDDPDDIKFWKWKRKD